MMDSGGCGSPSQPDRRAVGSVLAGVNGLDRDRWNSGRWVAIEEKQLRVLGMDRVAVGRYPNRQWTVLICDHRSPRHRRLARVADRLQGAGVQIVANLDTVGIARCDGLRLYIDVAVAFVVLSRIKERCGAAARVAGLAGAGCDQREGVRGDDRDLKHSIGRVESLHATDGDVVTRGKTVIGVRGDYDRCCVRRTGDGYRCGLGLVDLLDRVVRVE